MELVTAKLNDNFASTEDGQKHLNRIAKAITNESLIKRTANQRKTLAETAFNKELAKIVGKSPERVSDFVSRKAAWVTDYIVRKYGKDEDQ